MFEKLKKEIRDYWIVQSDLQTWIIGSIMKQLLREVNNEILSEDRNNYKLSEQMMLICKLVI